MRRVIYAWKGLTIIHPRISFSFLYSHRPFRFSRYPWRQCRKLGEGSIQTARRRGDGFVQQLFIIEQCKGFTRRVLICTYMCYILQSDFMYTNMNWRQCLVIVSKGVERGHNGQYISPSTSEYNRVGLWSVHVISLVIPVPGNAMSNESLHRPTGVFRMTIGSDPEYWYLY